MQMSFEDTLQSCWRIFENNVGIYRQKGPKLSIVVVKPKLFQEIFWMKKKLKLETQILHVTKIRKKIND